MRGEVERGGRARTPNPDVWWVRVLIPVPSSRRSRTQSTPLVHRTVHPVWVLRRRTGRGRPESFGYEPYMCSWEHQHTEPGPVTAKARAPRHPA